MLAEFLPVIFGVQPKRVSVKKAHSQPIISTSAAEPRRPLPSVFTVQFIVLVLCHRDVVWF